MKLEEISNMSDEEFITYVNKFIPEESQAIKEIDDKACKKNITGSSILMV